MVKILNFQNQLDFLIFIWKSRINIDKCKEDVIKELQSFVFIVTIFYALEFFVSLKERMMFYSRFSFDGR